MNISMIKQRVTVAIADAPSTYFFMRKELRDLFLSLRAYLMATITFIGISFFMYIQTEIPFGTDPIVEMVIALLSLLGLFYAVAFSMDSIVNEKTLRTMPLIRSAPVSAFSIVLGKFSAIVITWTGILVVSLLYFVLGGRGLVGQVSWWNLILGYASTILVVGAMGSAAIFISSISSTVKSSALGSLGFLFGFMGLSVARQLFGSFESVMDILDVFRNLSVIRYSSMITDEVFASGTDAIWGVAGLLAYIVIFMVAAIAIVGLREGDLP
jgi:ABC-type transport system involved in multi-copper enzyme maturation permease subunit